MNGHESREMASRQRRGAMVSGLVLGAMVVAIYLVVMLKFFAQA